MHINVSVQSVTALGQQNCTLIPST